jgi:hypothetical protein
MVREVGAVFQEQQSPVWFVRQVLARRDESMIMTTVGVIPINAPAN